MIVNFIFLNFYLVRGYSDFYKWQLIVSIMKTMKTFPLEYNTNSIPEMNNLKNNLRKKVIFPDDLINKILNPPI